MALNRLSVVFLAALGIPINAMFRLWYMAGKRAGTGLSYAESTDGFNWIKPMISKDGESNLVTWNAPVPILNQNKNIDLLDIGLDGTTVTIDPNLEYGSPEKYKVAFYPNSGGIDGKTRLGYSADGIHWNLYHDGYPVTERAADTNNRYSGIRSENVTCCTAARILKAQGELGNTAASASWSIPKGTTF